MSTPKSFEQNLKALEKVVQKLESGSTSLDESITLFQKGRALGKDCQARLKEVEGKIQMLLEDEEGHPKTELFDTETTDQQ